MRTKHRAATIFASVFTLIQSVIWCLISIYSIAIYACKVNYPFNLNENQLYISDLLYQSYFYGQCRALPGEPLVEPPSAERTYHWMLVYGIFCAVWIPTSVLLMVAACTKVRGNCGLYLYLPWIINTAAVIVVDLCTTIIYGIDISHTLTIQDYAQFLRPLIISAKGADGITVMPAVIMTIYFSRAIIIWVINLVLFGVVIQGSVAVRRTSPPSAFIESEARVKPTNDDSSSRWVNIRTDDMSLKRLPRLQVENSPVLKRTPLAPVSPQSPLSETAPTSTARPISVLVPTPKPVSFTDDDDFDDDDDDSKLRRGNSSPVYDVYGKHLGNAFPDDIHKHIPTNDAALKSGLSNQVPWTYAQPGELNLRIKQAAFHNRDATKPTIPVPDYTMHYQPSKRPGITSVTPSRSTTYNTANPDTYSEHSQNRNTTLY